MSPRSYLYVPGDRPDVLAKSLSRGADALIIDLEDAVAPSAKVQARQYVSSFLSEHSTEDFGSTQIWVRVNGDGGAAADIAAVAHSAVTGFCLAKAESPEDVLSAADACEAAESVLGLAAGSFSLAPLLESAVAILDARVIAACSPRVSRLQVGEADLRADIGASLGPDERELLFVRSSIVLASAATGIEPPVGPVSTNFRDLDALRESSLALKRLGYFGRACIHPAQTAVVNEVFTPSSAEVDTARDLVGRYEASVERGEGVFTDANGRMVDLAIIRQALRLL